MADRATLLRQVAERLGSRQLVWAGLRGADLEPLSDIPQLSASFSIVGDYSGRSDVASHAYENNTGVRVDPEVWDIDEHRADEATLLFRHRLLAALSPSSALVSYRPSTFLSAIHFARRDRCWNLGLFGAHQSVFEHKPFVESAVAELDVPHVPWTYVADEEQLQARDLDSPTGLVLRRSRTSGGEGFVRISKAMDVAAHWPSVREGFVSVAPYIADAIPVNVGATVWPNARESDCVSVHWPSVQLIGIESCVTRPFGYCGNDFSLARELDSQTIEQIDQSTKAIGRWLRSMGYVGSFGVDYLVHDGVPLFTEVNPRFQGSTRASCQLSVERGEACLMLEHLAAWLRVEKPEEADPLGARVREMPDLANIAVHWTGEEARTVDGSSLVSQMFQVMDSDVRFDSLVPHTVSSDPGSLVTRLTLRQRVTESGFELVHPLDQALRQWRGRQTTSEATA